MLTGPVLRIDADVRSGNLTIVTRPGIVVDADDVSVGSGNVKVRSPWAPGVPEILRVEVTGRVRSGNITARPPRRTFWQWLARAPRPYAAAIARRPQAAPPAAGRAACGGRRRRQRAPISERSTYCMMPPCR